MGSQGNGREPDTHSGVHSKVKIEEVKKKTHPVVSCFLEVVIPAKHKPETLLFSFLMTKPSIWSRMENRYGHWKGWLSTCRKNAY